MKKLLMTLALIACAATALAQGLRRPQRKSASQMARPGASADQKRQSCVTTMNGVVWTYEVVDGAIVLGGRMKTAVPENTPGALTIPATIDGLPVRGIGKDAFENCSALTSVTIPFGVTNIGETAFLECSGLVSVTIPSSVTRIEREAFMECRSLKAITIPPSVTSIEEGMFVGCGGLESVIIPPSVTSIEAGSFQRCSGLTSVTIPFSVTNIEESAFSFCSGAMAFCVDESNPLYSSRGGMLCSKDGTVLVAGVNGDVEIPSGVKRIAPCAFWGYGGVTSVTIPSCVTNIGHLAFDFCDGLTNVVIAGDNSFYSAEEGVLYNKTKTELIRCWVNKKSAVIIPPSVVNVRDRAFQGCKNLSSVSIPSSVTNIEYGAFGGTPFCNNMPDGMVVLGGGVLYEYKGEIPPFVTIPTNVTIIGDYAFSGRRSGASSRRGLGLRSVTIPSSVVHIGNRAFRECYGLTNIVVDSGCKFYCSEDGVLYDRTRTELICWPTGRKGDATIPSGVASIAGGAFEGCGGLKSVTIPASVTNIGPYAFSHCRCLKQIIVETGNPRFVSIDGVLCSKDGTGLIMWPNGKTPVTIPKGVTRVGDGSFSGGVGLPSLVLPSTVRSIGSWAFNGCDELVSVTIPASVKSIGRGAFWNCRKLAKVTMCGERPASQDSIFFAWGRLRAIHVPAHCKSWAGMSHWQKIPLVFVDNLRDLAGKDPAVQK